MRKINTKIFEMCKNSEEIQGVNQNIIDNTASDPIFNFVIIPTQKQLKSWVKYCNYSLHNIVISNKPLQYKIHVYSDPAHKNTIYSIVEQNLHILFIKFYMYYIHRKKWDIISKKWNEIKIY